MRIAAAAIFLSLIATGAGALDMAELAPCKPAATRLCDRGAGINYGNLLRCGATLAAHRFQVGNRCREVLKRYGQL
jgi:hypothetical protein